MVYEAYKKAPVTGKVVLVLESLFKFLFLRQGLCPHNPMMVLIIEDTNRGDRIC